MGVALNVTSLQEFVPFLFKSWEGNCPLETPGVDTLAPRSVESDTIGYYYEIVERGSGKKVQMVIQATDLA